MNDRPLEEKTSFGAWVRRRRRALDLTQAQLGELAACTESAIRKIEADERRPSRRIAERLADALKVPPAERERFIVTARGEERLDGLDMPEVPAPGTSAAGSTGNLPPVARELIGRESEMALIHARLADPSCRLLTIVGAGGMGKTRLALAAAAAAAPQFPEGVWAVTLVAAESSEMLLSALARTFGLSFPVDSDLERQLHFWLRNRQTLIVLDNFEQLANATGAIAALLDAAPQVKILVTSRERLNLGAEWLLRLDGLAVADDGSDARAESAAVRLFRARAGRVRPDFPESADELRDAARICALVEGMPLAIELAAAWVRALPCREILAEIRRNADFLRTDARDAPARHASLRATLDYSIGLLGLEERQAFARVSVFRGPFDREAAQTVAGAGLPQLILLADKSLLRTTSDGRFAMHELLRQFARERLAADPQAEQRILEAHSLFFLRILIDEKQALAGTDVGAPMSRIMPIFSDIRAAWFQALANREYELIEDAAGGMFWVHEIGSMVNEATAFLGQTNELVESNPEATGTPSGRYVHAMGHGFLGWDLIYRGRLDEALHHSVTAAQRIQPLKKNIECALSFSTAAIAAAMLGRHEQARELLRQAVEIEPDATTTKVPGFDSGLQVSIGMAHMALGDLAECEARLHRALAMRPGAWAAGGANLWLGDMAERNGQVEEARRYWQEAARLWVQLHDRHPQRVLAISRLGRSALAGGDMVAARRWFEQALAESRDVGFAPYIANALGHLAKIDTAEGKHEDALRCQQEALQVSLASGNRIGEIRALIQIGHSERALGRPAGAYEAWRAAAGCALEADAIRYARRAFAALADLTGIAPTGTPSETGTDHSHEAQRMREQLAAMPAAMPQGAT